MSISNAGTNPGYPVLPSGYASSPAYGRGLPSSYAAASPDSVALGAAPTGQYQLPTRLHVGSLPSGRLDGITDVPGVLVGQITMNQGDIHDGATEVLPNRDPWYNKVAAASYTINGNGALTNHDWVDESGRLETGVTLVGNTLDVGRAYDGVINQMIAQHPQIGRTEDVPLPVVGEIDGQCLNDAQARAVTAQDIAAMISSARPGQFARGSVGAGTPSKAFQYKAGIGSSSRVLPASMGGYTVGVLVNANMDVRDHLTMAGVPVGTYLPHNDLPRTDPNYYKNRGRAADGSIIIVVATDAPLTPLQLKQLAKRTAAGLYRSGSISRLSSGDQVIAFSTSRVTHLNPQTGALTPSPRPEISDENTLNTLFSATADATESAIDNSLMSSKTMKGAGGTVYGLPVDILMKVLANPPRPTISGNTIYT
jgi:D-aminopeptidase